MIVRVVVVMIVRVVMARLRVHGATDRLVFLVRQPLGYLEGLAFLELVEQGPFQASAGGLCEFLFDLSAHHILERGQVVHPEKLGEIIVDLDRFRLANFGHLGLEDRVLAGQVGLAVILGKGHLDLYVVAGLGADQLILEAGEELVRAQFEVMALGGAALESLAVDRTGEVDYHHVAVLGPAILGDRLGALVVLGKPANGLVEFLVARLGGHFLER